MKSKLLKLGIFSIATIVGSYGCKKNWLDAKPDKSLVIPSTIRDYQALLDNFEDNSAAPFNSDQSILDEYSTTDYSITDAVYDSKTPSEQAAYKWAPDIYAGSVNSIFKSEWEKPYKRIFYTNIVLEGIEKIVPSPGEQLEWSNVKGTALFYRSYDFHKLAQLFCKPYDATTASTDLGIPLRTASDINIPSVRATVEETYQRIILDLKEALPLVQADKPILTPQGAYQTDPKSVARANKAAVCAMLARVYLSMGNYDSAFNYADRSLQMYNVLMDLNTTDITTSSGTRIRELHKETLFSQRALSYTYISQGNKIVDSSLYKLYSSVDLRVPTFCRPNPAPSGPIKFYGEYTGLGGSLFTGLATDEVYLIRAEYYARKGQTAAAMVDLNTLWKKRSMSASYQDITATDAIDALRKILLERRKELCFRGLRWTDLRRLNKDPQFADTLRRTVKGQTYILLPNSPLYVLPIPPNVIQLTGMQQNERF